MLQSWVHAARMMSTSRLWAGHLKSFHREAGMQLGSRAQGFTYHQISLSPFLYLPFSTYQLSFPSLRTGFLHKVRNVVTKAPVFLTP